MSKIKNLEFLRVAGCLAVVMLHFCSTAGLGQFRSEVPELAKLMTMSNAGQKAVDLFFILSGFFFALKLDTTQSLWSFLKKKLIRLYPVMLFLILLYYLAAILNLINISFYNSIIDLLLLNGTSLTLQFGPGSVFWYISTMLWVMALIFYLRKYYSVHSTDLVVALSSFFAYALLIQAQKGGIHSHLVTYGYVFSAAMLRGIGGIGVGYFIAKYYADYSLRQTADSNPSWLKKLFCTALEGVCVAFIIGGMLLNVFRPKNQLLYIIVFALTIILFLRREGFISRLFENSLWSKLSQYTYSIYICHLFIRALLKQHLYRKMPEFVINYPILNVVLAISLSCLFGVAVYYLVEKPAAKYLKKYL